MPAIERHVQACDICRGDGECIECGSPGYDDCERCHGTSLCERCGGVGRVPVAFTAQLHDPPGWRRADLLCLELAPLDEPLPELIARFDAIQADRPPKTGDPRVVDLERAARARAVPFIPTPGTHVLAAGSRWQWRGESGVASFVLVHPRERPAPSGLHDVRFVELNLVRRIHVERSEGASRDAFAIAEVIAVHGLSEIGSRMGAIPEVEPDAPIRGHLIHGVPTEYSSRGDQVIYSQSDRELWSWGVIVRGPDGSWTLVASYRHWGWSLRAALGSRRLTPSDVASFGLRDLRGC